MKVIHSCDPTKRRIGKWIQGNELRDGEWAKRNGKDIFYWFRVGDKWYEKGAHTDGVWDVTRYKDTEKLLIIPTREVPAYLP